MNPSIGSGNGGNRWKSRRVWPLIRTLPDRNAAAWQAGGSGRDFLTATGVILITTPLADVRQEPLPPSLLLIWSSSRHICPPAAR